MRRKAGVRGNCILAAILAVLLFAASSSAQLFDWRNINGANYTTPIKSQGASGTCWAFAAAGALEAKLEISGKNPNWGPNVSEQHLVCDPSGGGSSAGGFEYQALNFIRTTGIVRESELPYTASDTSPNWPLASGWENRVYKISANTNWISNTNSNVKSALEAHGPLVAAMNTTTDWYWPANPPGAPAGGYGFAAEEESEQVQFVNGTIDPTGAIDHAVVVVGYKDDIAVPGGGYWIIRNSWGAGWGDSGHGYIRYGVMEGHNRIHAITGTAYWAPEPTSVSLLAIGALLMLRRRRRA